ncbi:hypothetical protein [Dyadobacter sp. CY343]|uniref:hypothetical protein n=1 Tax=Dyadobacter sp. CY343 TaxID=2907299 RepID=UPI001F2372B7|nr:hypothetical protein [Dyadobacter sp. CY343]MCE7060110.1 hypothetical protein [Dyadobacter sp. CY343]
MGQTTKADFCRVMFMECIEKIINWKEQLSKFEETNNGKSAISLMQETININGSSIEAYLSFNYLLMNLLVEEEYDSNDHDYYAGLLKKYFIESYDKFSYDPKYLFYIAHIARMSEWYFNIEISDAQSMMEKASELEPDSILYKWAKCCDLDMRDSSNVEKMILYAKHALLDTNVKEELKSNGALGQYLLDLLRYWSKKKLDR